MNVDLHWPKAIDSLETAVYNELRNRLFDFDTVDIWFHVDPYNMQNIIVTIIDRNNDKNRIIDRRVFSLAGCDIPDIDVITMNICDSIIDNNLNRVKYRGHVCICPNCGAPVNAQKCSYCGTVFKEEK